MGLPRLARTLTLALVGLATFHGWADDDFPHQLHVIRKAGSHRVQVGDLLQVRYQTRSAANGIGNLEVKLSNDRVQRIALVNKDIDPTKPGQPGSLYFIAVLMRAEKAGTTAVKITPVTND